MNFRLLVPVGRLAYQNRFIKGKNEHKKLNVASSRRVAVEPLLNVFHTGLKILQKVSKGAYHGESAILNDLSNRFAGCGMSAAKIDSHGGKR